MELQNTLGIVLRTIIVAAISTTVCSQIACPVTPELTSESICQLPMWGVSITCISPSSVIVWSGSILVGHYVVPFSLKQSTSPALIVNGVHATESHTNNSHCLSSTLTFYGSNLNDFKFIAFSCGFFNYSEADILIPSVPDSPKFILAVLSSSCSGSLITLQWSSPSSIKEIDLYTLDVTGHPEFTCSPEECQVNSTNTTISGLMDNTSYTFIVRALNCIGVGNYSQPLKINVPPLSCELNPNLNSSIETPTIQGTDGLDPYFISTWILLVIVIIAIFIIILLITLGYIYFCGCLCRCLYKASRLQVQQESDTEYEVVSKYQET